MKRQRYSPQQLLFIRVAVCAGAVVGLAGCPQGGELEDPESYVIDNGIAGTTGVAGSAGSAGSSGTMDPLPTCDWKTGLSKSCAFAGCHAGARAIGGLNLAPDEGLIGRIKDVVATNLDLDCDPTDLYLACETPPAECTPYLTAKLIDSANPEASYLLTKMSASGCGNEMPLAPGNMSTQGWNEERRMCIENLWRAIAALP